MENISEQIYTTLSNQKSVFLIGATNSGKTWYIENELVPFLKEKKFQAVYFKDCDSVLHISKEMIAIVDEVETLSDINFLENRHKEKSPYYSSEYLEKVKRWHSKLQQLPMPGIFVITRNNKEDIDYLINNIHTTDWGMPVKCIYLGGQSRAG